MTEEENQQGTKTLTNPHLNHRQSQIQTKDVSNLSQLNHQIDQGAEKNTTRKFENTFQTLEKDKKSGIFKTQAYYSPEIKKQSSYHAQDENVEEFKSSEFPHNNYQSFNMKAKQALTFFKLEEEQIFKNYKKPLSLKGKQNIFQDIKKQSQKLHQNNFSCNNLDSNQSDVYEDCQSDDDFQDRFILSGANLQKNFVTLTIQEKKVKSVESTGGMDNFQQVAFQKMQIEGEIINAQSLKFEQKIKQKKSHESFQFRQQTVFFSLKDAREIRQIRFFTPIKSLKKYVLRKFGYSQGARNCQKLHLSFYNLYPNQSPKILFPITNEQNLELIILQFIKAKRDLCISFENDGSLRKKVERKQGKNQVQFDSDGQLQDSDQSQNDQNQNEQDVNDNHSKQIKEMIRVNKTQKSRYRGAKPVRCAFCHKTNKDIENIKVCGPFYGPFLRGKIKTKHYTHLLCALWCKKVYLNDDNELKEIASQINRSQRKECKYCDKKGAGLLCHGCNSSMHYECGLGKCEYLWSTYEVYCDKCHQKYLKYIEKKGKNGEDRESSLIEIESSNLSKQDAFERMEMVESNERNHTDQLSINQIYSITGFDHQKLQQSNSRTQSLNVGKIVQSSQEKINLKIDMNNRIQINNETPEVEILQEKCKPPKKSTSSEVKLQQQSIEFKSKQKPQRRRRQKKKN